MITMLCNNRVLDYHKWKLVFDSHLAGQQDAGLKFLDMWQDLDDPNNVFFNFEVIDLEKARAFISDPAGEEVGKISGVIDGWFRFVESVHK